jgi:hypothetical protein
MICNSRGKRHSVRLIEFTCITAFVDGRVYADFVGGRRRYDLVKNVECPSMLAP